MIHLHNRMHLSKQQIYLVGLLTLLTIVSVGVFLFLVFFTAPPSTDHAVVALQFDRYRAATNVFKERYSDYENMCPDLSLPETVVCASSATGYRLSQALSDGTYYCIDSRGFAGSVDRQPTGLHCQ